MNFGSNIFAPWSQVLEVVLHRSSHPFRPTEVRKARTRRSSKIGSTASMQIPKPSDATRFMYGVSCSGWLLFGNLKKITIIDTTVSTARQQHGDLERDRHERRPGPERLAADDQRVVHEGDPGHESHGPHAAQQAEDKRKVAER